ncbi:hypothetical protein C8N24_0385 [Solirubrobacter pauli]|uniref:Ig-like domain-containing protein n=1 Tax=Solirubrobacter pauli TaxID=166793 RepID=A0A660L9Q9_9ACTN|nr:hypothetical protein [Solirubrobacter pauli]RKQ90573.1 hypothetical protein C8N24_0385 [Solirubrobacter pauli]
MRIAQSLLAAAVSMAAFAAPAVAAPPPNDPYLASSPIDRAEFTTTVDTTEATTQPDLFNPSRDGLPLGGGSSENTACKGAIFGKTVWYDLPPRFSGGVELSATAAFPVAVAVYEWNDASQITRMVDCTTSPGPLRLVLAGKRNYTVQVGGVGAAGGPIAFKADVFFDKDDDGSLDELDKCPEVAGIERFGGCPPELKVTPALSWAPAGNGIEISRLAVDRVPKGAKLVVKCKGCGSQTVRAKKQGRVVFNKLAGKTVRAGANIELLVTLGKTGKSTYKFGATGSYFKWPVKASGLGARQSRCIAVGTASKLESCK